MTRARTATVLVLTTAAVYAAGGAWWWPHSRLGFWAGTVLMIVGPAAGGALAVRRAVGLSGRARSSWLLLGLGAWAWCAGTLVWSWYEVVLQASPPFPGLPDVGYLAALGLLAAGVLRYPAVSRRRWSLTRSGLDAALVMSSAVLLSWVVVLGSVYATSDAGWFERTVAMAYPAGDVLILVFLLLLARRTPVGGREALVLLLAGMGLMVFADTGYLLLSAHDAYYTGSPIDIGWWAGLLVVGLAATAYRESSVPEERDPLRPRSVLLPYVVTVTALGAITVHWLTGQAPNAFEIVLVAVVVTLLLARQSVVALDSVHLAHELRRREDELVHHAYHDPLTGLPNRRSLRDHLDAQIVAGAHGDAVLFIDLDGFKAVNDSLGHEAGDLLLQEAAGRLRRTIRGEDLVARLGGDEFAVLLAPGSNPDQAAQRLLGRMSDPFDVADTTVAVSASIGIAPWDGEQTGEELLRNADLAMYEAKSAGRNQASGYQPALHEQARTRLDLQVALRHALDAGEFRLHYQPLVHLDSGQLAGVEALVRWNRDGQLLAPAEFLDVAEETGLIVPLGDWVLDQACADLASWLAAAPVTDLVVAVNVADRQLADPAFAQRVRSTLARRGLTAAQLTLEITESVVLDRDPVVHAVLTELAELGVSLSLDDFGTGYASLSSLRTLPVRTVKIDRSFIADLGADHSALVDGVAYLADRLGLAVVAEGVETSRQRQRLRESGIGFAQGYYFAHPMPAAGIPELLTHQVETPARSHHP